MWSCVVHLVFMAILANKQRICDSSVHQNSQLLRQVRRRYFLGLGIALLPVIGAQAEAPSLSGQMELAWKMTWSRFYLPKVQTWRLPEQ